MEFPRLQPPPSADLEEMPKMSFPSISPPKSDNIFRRCFNLYLNATPFKIEDYATSKAPLILPNISKENAISIVEEATEIFKSGPTLLELESPLYIVGDIHGHILDLFRILRKFGLPESQDSPPPSSDANVSSSPLCPDSNADKNEIEIDNNTPNDTNKNSFVTPPTSPNTNTLSLIKSGSSGRFHRVRPVLTPGTPDFAKGPPILSPPPVNKISQSLTCNTLDDFPMLNPEPISNDNSDNDASSDESEEIKGPTKYLLLGDLVDRGEFSVETILLCLLLKILYPDSFNVIRGNHEFEFLCTQCGFSTQLAEAYGPDMLPKFLTCFSYMPLAAKIDKNILCVHGGLGPNCFSVKQISKIERPIPDFNDELLNALLWSDPSKDTSTFSPSNRGTGYLFGDSALKEFVDSNDLKLLVRAHECVMEGYEYNFDKQCLTVFSASNYCGLMNNKCAVIHVADSTTVKEYQFPPLCYLKRDNVMFKGNSKAPRRVSTITMSAIKRPLISNTFDHEKLPHIARKQSEFPSLQQPRKIHFQPPPPQAMANADKGRKPQALPSFMQKRRFSTV